MTSIVGTIKAAVDAYINNDPDNKTKEPAPDVIPEKPVQDNRASNTKQSKPGNPKQSKSGNPNQSKPGNTKQAKSGNTEQANRVKKTRKSNKVKPAVKRETPIEVTGKTPSSNRKPPAINLIGEDSIGLKQSAIDHVIRDDVKLSSIIEAHLEPGKIHNNAHKLYKLYNIGEKLIKIDETFNNSETDDIRKSDQILISDISDIPIIKNNGELYKMIEDKHHKEILVLGKELSSRSYKKYPDNLRGVSEFYNDETEKIMDKTGNDDSKNLFKENSIIIMTLLLISYPEILNDYILQSNKIKHGKLLTNKEANAIVESVLEHVILNTDDGAIIVDELINEYSTPLMILLLNYMDKSLVFLSENPYNFTNMILKDNNLKEISKEYWDENINKKMTGDEIKEIFKIIKNN